MEICCRGAVEGGCTGCARVGAARARRTTNVRLAKLKGPAVGRPDDRIGVPTTIRSAWATFVLPTLGHLRNSIIDDHAPGNAAHRNRHRGLAGLEIDNGDIVAEAVGDIKRLLVARHAETPRALADQDV